MITYLPALPEDVEILFGLNKQLIDEYEDLSSINYPRVLDWVCRNIEQNLPAFNRVLHDGTLVGYYSLNQADGKMELDSLFVLPPFRGQGIGTEVLKKCLSESPVPVFLYVFRKNTGALALYKRLGFQVVKEVGKTRYIMENDPHG